MEFSNQGKPLFFKFLGDSPLLRDPPFDLFDPPRYLRVRSFCGPAFLLLFDSERLADDVAPLCLLF